MRLTADGQDPPLPADRPRGRPEADRCAAAAATTAYGAGILAALATKPDAHHLSDGNRPQRRKMIQIGG